MEVKWTAQVGACFRMAAVTTAGVDAEDDSCIYDVGVTNVRII